MIDSCHWLIGAATAGARHFVVLPYPSRAEDFAVGVAELTVKGRVDDGVHTRVDIAQPDDDLIINRLDGIAPWLNDQHQKKERKKKGSQQARNTPMITPRVKAALLSR
jgi:hypothetical protein